MHEPEIIEGQFEVAETSAKAGPETVKRGFWGPFFLSALSVFLIAGAVRDTQDPTLRSVMVIVAVLQWPFWRGINWIAWAAQCKVSEEDAEKLSARYPNPFQRRSKA